MSDQQSQEPTHDEIMAEVERHNAEIRNKKEGVQIGSEARKDVPLTDQMSQKIADLFTNKALEAGAKNEQMILIRGKPKRFLYHAIYQDEKAEISAMEERRAQSIVNAAQYVYLKKQGKEVENFSKVDMEYRYLLANKYLIDPTTNQGMTREDFNGTNPEQMNYIIEGYIWRTEKPLPPPFEIPK